MAIREGRFKGGRAPGVPEFTASIGFDQRLYRQDLAGSRAHATMLGECGIIPVRSARRIVAELNRLERRIAAGKFEFRAELEDIHMHLEQALTAALGEEGARLHTARSRNDQIAVDLRLWLRDELDALGQGVRNLQRALVGQAAQHRSAIMPGFTHLQHAQPVLLAHHLLAYVEMFERDRERLADCRRRVNVMPLGAGALAGTSLPINRERVAELLGFPRISQNSMDAVADRDQVCEALAALSILMMHVSRLGEDVILWCTTEFGFAEPGDEYCTGSSLMPQKKNPDLVELCRGKAARVYGALMSLLSLCKNLPLTYNSDLQEDKEPLFDAVDTVRGVLAVLPGLIGSLRFNCARMRAAAADPFLMATDLAEELVRSGMPFRIAHQRVGALVRHCRETGISPERLSLAAIRKVIPEATPACLEVFSPERSVAARELPGGTGPRQVARQLAAWRRRLGGE